MAGCKPTALFPLFNQASDLAGELGVVLVGHAAAGSDQPQQVLGSGQQLFIDLLCPLGALEDLDPVNGPALGVDRHLTGEQIVLGAAVRCFRVVSHVLQALLEGLALVIVTMVDEYCLGFFLKTAQPVQQTRFVGMAGGTLQGGNFRIDGNFFTEELHCFHAVLELPAQGAFRLITDEENDALTAPQVVLQVVSDSARFAHTAGREDHLGVGMQFNQSN